MAEAAKLPVTDAARADAGGRRVHRQLVAVVGGGVASSLAAVLVGIRSGPVPIGVGAIVESPPRTCLSSACTRSSSATDSAILWQLRLPRVVLGLLVGAMLSCAGATYQGVVPEPARRPVPARRRRRRRARRDAGDRLRAGAGARAATCSRSPRSPAASLAVVIAYSIGRCGGRDARLGDARARGRDRAAFLTAIQTFVQQQHADTLQAVYSWILGSLDTAGWHDVLADPALRGAQRRRAAAAPARARRHGARRRGGRGARRQRRPRRGCCSSWRRRSARRRRWRSAA